MTELNLAGNSLQGSSDYSDPSFIHEDKFEFIPGLAKLYRLHRLNLSSNRIVRLGRGQFKNNTQLQFIYLDSNQIGEIGEDSFLFHPDERDLSTSTEPSKSLLELNLNLNWNNLTGNSFKGNPGWGRIHRPVKLTLRFNHLEFIPADPLERFLSAHQDNSLDLTGNPLMCDKKLWWLKRRGWDFFTSVFGADCSDDQNKTIFTSEFVSGEQIYWISSTNCLHMFNFKI
jgi:hypothetical protein